MRRPAPRIAWGLALCAAAFARAPLAAPPTSAEVAALCASAEDQSHCGRLVEAAQLPRLPGLAVRNGDELRVALYPTGTATFRDEVRISGARTYALWDALDRINGVVLFTTDGDRTGFTLLLRATGGQYRLPAEPLLSPDRQYIVTADFCASGCDNEVALWRVTRDSVAKERAFRPVEAWIEASATWMPADRLAIEYRLPGVEAFQRFDLPLADPRWRSAR